MALANAMFFAAIGQVFKRPMMAGLMLAGTSLLALVLGTMLVVTLSVLTFSRLH